MSSREKIRVLKGFKYYRNDHRSGDQTLIVEKVTRPVFAARLGANLYLERVVVTRYGESYRLYRRDRKRFVTITGNDLKRMLADKVLAYAQSGRW